MAEIYKRGGAPEPHCLPPLWRRTMTISRRSFLTTAAATTTVAASGCSPAWAQDTPRIGKAGGLAYRSVSELRAMLEARQVSSMELLDDAVARINAHDPE